MFLSRVPLNLQRRSARFLLGSAQRVHAAVLMSFPDPPTGTVVGPRVLWRLDREGPRAWLYVTSPTRPDFTSLVEQAGWPAADDAWLTKDYQPFVERLAVGQRWNFRVVANTVKKIRLSSEEPQTRHQAVLSVERREKWLVERSARFGFTIPDSAPDEGLAMRVSAMDIAEFSRRDAERGTRATVTVARTQFDGVLHVTDPDALRVALTEGIGRAKAYGCGLITLAPA